ncbi:MAG: CHRD domain-containing protein [Telluria sp.]
MKRLSLALFAILFLQFAAVAQAGVVSFSANLSGLNEEPQNASPATGLALLSYDDVTNILSFNVTFSGLLGNTTAAHIHCCTMQPFSFNAGVATTLPSFQGFPLGVTSGQFIAELDLLSVTSYSPAFLSANGGTPATAGAALLANLSAGRAYLNIHTSMFAGGEIRGFPVPVPEPGSLALMGLGVSGLIMLRRRRKG